MKAILEKRIQNQSLTKDEAKNTLLDIGQGKCNSHQVAAFLTTYMMSVSYTHLTLPTILLV